MEPYKEIWDDAWRFFKYYLGKLPMSDTEWEELIQMFPKFVARHPDHQKLARKMIIAVESELEERDREARKENGTWEQ